MVMTGCRRWNMEVMVCGGNNLSRGTSVSGNRVNLSLGCDNHWDLLETSDILGTWQSLLKKQWSSITSWVQSELLWV